MTREQLIERIEEIENRYELRSKMPEDICQQYDVLNREFVGLVWEERAKAVRR